MGLRKHKEQSKQSKYLCHIHDKVKEFEDVNDIREKVCVNDEPLTEFEGKHYCLFHLPTKDKDNDKFEEKFKARLKEVEERIAAIEELPEVEQEEAKRKVSYDFCYVYFTSLINFRGYKFEIGVDFRSAVFTQEVFFIDAMFTEFASFNRANFTQKAYFTNASFNQGVAFSSAIFTKDAIFAETLFNELASFDSVVFIQLANFHSATFIQVAAFFNAIFLEHADFSETTFTQTTYFKSVIFVYHVSFRSAKFLETSQTLFQQMQFCNEVDFGNAFISGYISFEGSRILGNVFLGKEDAFAIKIKLGWKGLEQKVALQQMERLNHKDFNENDEAVLNLQNARLEKPERISFHRVRLCPSWFVNIDSREMVFTDVRWDKLDRKFRNTNITAEIESLKSRNVSEPSRLLEIACRQLAVNAEENNRYEHASDFRYMAMETKRLEYRWHGRLWTLSWWYRFSSGYGENWDRSLLILATIIFAVFPIIYSQTNFQTCSKDRPVAASLTICESKDEEIRKNCTCSTDQITFTDAIVQSLTTATLQNVEYRKPLTVWGELWIILEKIFAPLQAALLALAIRRKFMR